MREQTKIFLTCVIGAFIGILTTLLINPHFWWVGAIIGTVVAYCYYPLNDGDGRTAIIVSVIFGTLIGTQAALGAPVLTIIGLLIITIIVVLVFFMV